MADRAPTQDSLEVLALLKERRNVLLSGPPATGKSRLLSEVAAAFERRPAMETAPPRVQPVGRVALPIRQRAAPAYGPFAAVMPAPDRADRKVFRTVLHQASKHRDFLTGIVPNLLTAADREARGADGQFRITEGVLYRASQHALAPDGTSLVIIDEINRGPAVQVFGGAIVAMEGEKRLADDNARRLETQYFDLLDPVTRDTTEYAFPAHLYILAAMNQADVSVEPLDVAFLRRWAHHYLEPDQPVLRTRLGLSMAPVVPPAVALDARDVYEAAVQAWSRVNERITLGRGQEFRIGHGAMLPAGGEAPSDLDGALLHASRAWRAIRAHVDEVFFGDVQGVATVLNASPAASSHPYSLVDEYFGEVPRQVLNGPRNVGSDQVYGLLLHVAAN